MPRRRAAINFSVSPRRAGPVPASPGVGRRFLWGVEERLVWGTRDAVGALADVVRWPFERVTWATEERVVWPLQDRSAELSTPVRIVGTVLLAAAAIAAGVFGATRAADESGAPVAQVAAPEPALSAQPAPATAPVEPAEPVLQGAVPDFTPPGAAKLGSADAVAKGDAAKAATTSGAATGKVVSPGPSAMKVARNFAAAFVLYETGRADAEVRSTIRQAATPQLAEALLARPPRLPAEAKVPKAKVLNVVPGPVEAGVHTVSASLLRVGLTSELRLEIERDPKSRKWQITDVLG